MFKKSDGKVVIRRKLVLDSAKTALFRRPGPKNRASATKWADDDFAAISDEMALLNERRARLPSPEETQAFGLWPEKLDASRNQELENLYTENAVFKRLVDELRKNRRHYISQLSAT